jgi:hypothetical protein
MYIGRWSLFEQTLPREMVSLFAFECMKHEQLACPFGKCLQNVENGRFVESTAMLEGSVDGDVSAGRDETHVVIGSGGGASAVQKFHEAIVPHKLLPFSHLQDSLRPGARYQQMHSCSLPARLFHFCCGNRCLVR